MSNGSYEIVVEGGDSYDIVVETSQVGPRGPQGIAGPNTVTEETSTPLQGVLVADGERIREALPGEVVNAEAMQAALPFPTRILAGTTFHTGDYKQHAMRFPVVLETGSVIVFGKETIIYGV